MEALPQLPVEEGKKKVNSLFAQINNSPKKMLGVMVGISVLISLFFFGFLFLDQESEIARSKKEQEQARKAEQDLVDLDSETYDLRRRQDLDTIAKALRSYKVNYGDYPTSLEGLVPEFLYRLPVDPVTKKLYVYRSSVDRRSFELRARLSNGDELSESGN